MRQKQAVSRQVALRYKKAGKKEKGAILNEFIETTGYNRSYAARVLRQKVKIKAVRKMKAGCFNIIVYEDRRRKKRKQKRIKSKKYDKAKTPCQRLLESKHLSSKVKKKLKSQYDKLNPAQLKRNITSLQNKLMRQSALKEKLRKTKMLLKQKNQQEELKIKKNFKYFF